MEKKEIEDPLEHKELQDLPDLKVTWVQLENKVQMDLKEKLVQLVTEE